MSKFNLKDVPQYQLVAFFGLPFVAASVDGDMEKEEMLLIFEQLDLEFLNAENRKKVLNYVIEPPSYEECISVLREGKSELKYTVVIRVVEILLADNLIEKEEQHFLDKMCRELGVNDEQKKAILNFVKESNRVQREGVDNNYAEKTIKNAISGLSAVGIPIAAVYFSGTVVGLSAAGITSGLAALGLGFGMVPGIGVAVLIGAGIFVGVKHLLGDDKEKKEKEIKLERERKLQLVIKNLQEAINMLIDRISVLEKKAKIAEANKEAINILRERLNNLQKVLRIKRELAS
jgi:hypothetical protein